MPMDERGTGVSPVMILITGGTPVPLSLLGAGYAAVYAEGAFGGFGPGELRGADFSLCDAFGAEGGVV